MTLIKTNLLVLKHSSFEEYACGHCGSILLGSDEEICPVCGSFVNWNTEQEITQTELEKISDEYLEAI